jgi:sugar O-acyltransferase (sialic acid O-acetyltransferase NeuD family)
MSDVVVIGAGGHAKVLISVLTKLGATLRGYVDPVDHGIVHGVPRLGDDSALKDLVGQPLRLALGIGTVNVESRRRALVAAAERDGFDFITAVSPDACVHSTARLSDGSMVFDGAVVQPDVSIGRFAILNTACSVDHDCEIGDFVHLAPGATLGGGVRVGENSLVGIGAVVSSSVQIGRDCCIGAGAVVTTDCLEPGTYVGVPARKSP